MRKTITSSLLDAERIEFQFVILLVTREISREMSSSIWSPPDLCQNSETLYSKPLISFSVAGPSPWNRLPPSARASFLSSNLSTSLSLLKTCLFSWS